MPGQLPSALQSHRLGPKMQQRKSTAAGNNNMSFGTLGFSCCCCCSDPAVSAPGSCQSSYCCPCITPVYPKTPPSSSAGAAAAGSIGAKCSSRLVESPMAHRAVAAPRDPTHACRGMPVSHAVQCSAGHSQCYRVLRSCTIALLRGIGRGAMGNRSQGY
jgi:hypothetical protein